MSKALPEKLEDKKFRFLAYFLGTIHLPFGLSKLAGVETMVAQWQQWGFPIWFLYFVGAAQLLGGICLFIRQLRLPASFSMALIMLGAIPTVINTSIQFPETATKSYINAVICFIVMVLCLLVAKNRLMQLVNELAAEKK